MYLKRGMLDKIKLGFIYRSQILESIYVKYHDIGKRKFFWTVWENDRGRYSSYEEFKRSWDSETKTWKVINKYIKTQIKSEVESLFSTKRPFDRPIDNITPISKINYSYRRTHTRTKLKRG